MRRNSAPAVLLHMQKDIHRAYFSDISIYATLSRLPCVRGSRCPTLDTIPAPSEALDITRPKDGLPGGRRALRRMKQGHKLGA